MFGCAGKERSCRYAPLLYSEGTKIGLMGFLDKETVVAPYTDPMA
jgi:hypothetical protein